MEKVEDPKFRAWLEWMDGLVKKAWERRINASTESQQMYWSWIIRTLKQDIEYEKERRGGTRGPPVLFRF